MSMLSLEELQRVLHYDPDTGVFRWTDLASNHRRGQIAGTPDKGGYIQICIGRKLFKGHRLAWLYVHGRWPAAMIDHINLVPSDNRISNLREATRNQNLANSRPRSAVGYKGVYVDHRRKKRPYCACIRVERRTIHLGTFSTAREAANAYAAAAREHFGEFARVSHGEARADF